MPIQIHPEHTLTRKRPGSGNTLQQSDPRAWACTWCHLRVASYVAGHLRRALRKNTGPPVPNPSGDLCEQPAGTLDTARAAHAATAPE